LRGNGITGTPRFNSTQHISVSSNKTIFKARVNQSAFTASFAQVTFDSVTTGAYTDIEVGMTVLFSASDDTRAAYHVGRVRKAPTSSVLYIDETSASIDDNDYIFVLNDYRIAQRLLRFANDTLFVDFDEAYSTPSPVIYGLQSGYAGFASGSPEGYTVAFTAQSFAVASGATISSYAWTLPSGTTVTGGATNTASVTVRFDPSADEYWIKLVVTDSNAVTATRYIPVWSHNDTYPPSTGFGGASVNGDLDTGFNASVNAFDGISALLDNTLVCIWSVDQYSDTEVEINNNVNFVGRLRREQTGGDGDASYSTLPRETQFEIEGPGSQLSRLTAPLFEIVNAVSPSIVGEITTLTLWRAIAYLLQVGSTYTTLHSLEFDSTADTFTTVGVITQGGSMLGAVNDLAESINSAMEFAPAGESRVTRNENYQTTSERNALTVVADWTETDTIGIGIQREMVNLIGRVEASGGTYNTNNGEVLPVLSLAPGVAQSEGEGTSQLTRQILTRNVTKASAQSELNTRSGHKFADANRNVTLNMTLPDGYYFLVPSRQQWHTWTISTTTNNRGIAYTTSTRWTLTSISHNADNATGTRDVTATFEIETIGAAGQSVEYPPPTEIDTALPALPAFNIYPSLPDLNFSLPSLDPFDLPAYLDTTGATETDVLSDGNTVAIATTTQVWILEDVKISTTPPATEVTPTLSADEDEIKAFQWSGFGKDGYLLTYDSTNDRSRIWYASDVLASNWTAGEWIPGVYSVLRTTGVQGEIYALRDSTSSDTTFEYYGGDGDLPTPYTLSYSEAGGGSSCTPTYNSGDDRIDGCTPAVGTSVGLVLTKAYSGQNVTNIVVDYAYNKTRATPGAASDIPNVLRLNGADVDTNTHSATGAGTAQLSWSGASIFNELEIDLAVRNNNGADGSYMRLTKLEFTIGGGATTVAVRYSADYGATVGNELTVGNVSTSGFAGFANIPISSEMLAGRNSQVESNMSAGGAFSDYGDPIPDAGVHPDCIVIPRYKFGTTVSNSTSTPDYICGSGTLDSGTSQISTYKVTASGVTFADITPNRAADYGTIVSNNALALPYNDTDKIAGIFDFAGTRYLYVSTPSGIGNWDDVGSVGDDADYVRMRKQDVDALDLYYVDDVLIHSPDFGQTRNSKTTPNDESTDPLILVEVYDV